MMELEDIKAALGENNDMAALQAAINSHVKGLKDKNAELISREKDAKDALAKFDGVDVDDMKAKLAAHEASENNGKTQLDRLAEQVTALQQSLTEKDEAAAKAINKAAASHAEAELLRGIEKVGGIPDALLKNLAPYVKGVDNAGQVGVEVYGSDGKRRFDSEGNPMTLDDLLKEHASDPSNAWGYKPSGLSGGSASNSKGSASGAKTVTRAEFDQMDDSSRANHFKEGGKVAD